MMSIDRLTYVRKDTLCHHQACISHDRGPKLVGTRHHMYSIHFSPSHALFVCFQLQRGRREIGKGVGGGASRLLLLPFLLR